MRQTCSACGSKIGYLTPRSGQNVVRCSRCHTYQYCAPRREAAYAEPEAETPAPEPPQLDLFGGR